MVNKIKLGIPNRELRDNTLELFRLAGYEANLSLGTYKATIDDGEIECFLVEVCDIPSYVAKGIIDVGVTQYAFVAESTAKMVEMAELQYGNGVWYNAKLVLSVPDESPVKTLNDLKDKKILSRVPNVTKEYLKEKGVEAEVEFVAFPGEPKVTVFGDALVDLTNTGAALRTYNLRIVDTLIESSVRVIMNEKSHQDEWKKEKVENMAMLLLGARRAKDMAGLMLHASGSMMEQVFKILPSFKKPTVTQLRGENWFDVLTVADKKELRNVIPKLKAIGCCSIVEFPLNKVIP